MKLHLPTRGIDVTCLPILFSVFTERAILHSMNRNNIITNRKTLVLINADPKDQVVFVEALTDVAPNTQFFLAENSVEALDIMLEDKIIPDCIIIELIMSGINGLEFLRRVKKMPELKHVPVIVHSRKPVPRRISLLKRMGAFAIYFKPYDYWGVCNMLNLYMHDSYNVSLN